MKNKEVIKLIFNVLILVCFANPFLLVFYMQFRGIDLQELIVMDPQVNILFITSFVLPFIGFYLLYLRKSTDFERESEETLLQLLFVAVSLFLMNNGTLAISILMLVFLMKYQRNINIKKAVRNLWSRPFNIKEWLAPISILVVSIAVRIMLMLVSIV